MKARNLLSEIGAVMALCALLSESAQAVAPRIGVALPTQNDTSWYQEGPILKRALEAKGYGVDLYYGGDNDVPIQQRQMGRMIKENGDQVLIVTPIEANSLIEPLKPVKAAGVPVISFDRLIMYSDASKYYVGFDSGAAGRLQAQAIIKALDLDNRSTPAKIELFCGDFKDRTSEMLMNNFLGTILEYTDKGKLEIPSGNMFLAMCATPGWSSEAALKRMDQIIADQGITPENKVLDAIYCANDSIASGVIQAYKKAGFTAKDMPYVTGMDATVEQLKGILNGERGSTIYKDPTALNKVVVDMVEALLNKKEPTINDTSSFNNGLYMMQSNLCEPVLVDKSNIKKLFIDTGILTQEDLR